MRYLFFYIVLSLFYCLFAKTIKRELVRDICKYCICYKNQINCYRRLPQNVILSKYSFRNVKQPKKYLLLRFNNIKKFPKNIFDNMIHVEIVDLSFLGLKKIDKDLFKYMTNIKDLELNGNMLESLPKGFVRNQKKLHELSLSFNSLTYKTIHSKAFEKQVSLQVLDIASNPLEKLPDISYLTNLRKLSAYNCNLKYIDPKLFKKLKKLANLGLEENHIKYISKEIMNNLPNLRYFGLPMNFLQKIPQINFKVNKKLKNFFVNNNAGFYCYKNEEKFKKIIQHKINIDIPKCIKTKEIAAFIGNLKSFEMLKKIPANITQLIIKNHNFKTLPEGIFDRFQNLEKIDLSFNKIENLPKKIFFKLKYINIINLSYNKMKTLPQEIFSKLNELNEIDLGGNKLNYKALNKNTFKNNPKLSLLQLGFNNIQTLHPMLFSKMKNINEIYISNNNIKEIPEILFQFNKNLNSIDFTENYLQKLPKKLFKNNPEMNSIKFLNNKLKLENILHVFDNLKKLRLLFVNGNSGVICINYSNCPNLKFVQPENCLQLVPQYK